MIDLEKLRSQALNGLPMSSVYVLELLDHISALEKDARRLDAIQDGCCDIRCEEHSEDSYGWAVYEHHMAEPKLRKIGESFRELGLRKAIDTAMESEHG